MQTLFLRYNYPSQVIFSSRLVQKSISIQSCDAYFTHEDSTSGCKRTFILHEYSHTTRVVTLSAGGLVEILDLKAYLGD